MLKGIIWVARTGVHWKDLPKHAPPYQTCHRRFQAWVEQGILSTSSRGCTTEAIAWVSCSVPVSCCDY
ncbi:MAG: transposase [Chloroflexaceae bacterium]|nr:transposase [Chloroflexaceae bacterium]